MQAANCAVRWATEMDVATILRMIKGLAEFEQCLVDVAITEEILERDLEAGLFECLLAERPSDCGRAPVCVGFALFCNRYSTTRGRCMYLQDLFVTAEARGGGVGQLLIHAVAQVTVSRSCAALLWCALEWNAGAIAFYLSSRVGARERLADADGTRFIDFVLDGDALEKLARKRCGPPPDTRQM